jgi:uncharacterized protein with HEPN domain
MPHDPRVWLEDMRLAAEAIMQFTRGRTLDEYRNVPMLHAAVERKFEIIGEALSRLARAEPDLASQIRSHREIIAFRN